MDILAITYAQEIITAIKMINIFIAPQISSCLILKNVISPFKAFVLVVLMTFTLLWVLTTSPLHSPIYLALGPLNAHSPCPLCQPWGTALPPSV